MKVKEYEVTKPTVEAVIITDENMKEVAGWCGGVYCNKEDEWIQIGDKKAFREDWVVKTIKSKGFTRERIKIDILSNYEFIQKYKEINV